MRIMLRGRVINRVRFLCAFLISTLLLISLFFSVLIRFKPVVEEKASHAAKSQAIRIINDATDSIFSDIALSEMTIIDKDNEGNIVSVSADSVEMNKLKSKLSKNIQMFAENAENTTIHIPIGSLTNIEVLQGFGYRIPINISTDGLAKIDFDDEFISVGINQVKHKIYMIASVRVTVVSSVYSKSETIETEIPVSETVISGVVPNYYGDKISVLGR